jgi:hypothetical protein
VSIFTIDITSRKKAESRLTVLAQVGQLLATSVESHLPSLLASMLGIVGGTRSPRLRQMRLCGPFVVNTVLSIKRAGSVVADWCIIDLVAENGSLKRIASPNAVTDLWHLEQLSPDEGTAVLPLLLGFPPMRTSSNGYLL